MRRSHNDRYTEIHPAITTQGRFDAIDSVLSLGYVGSMIAPPATPHEFPSQPNPSWSAVSRLIRLQSQTGTWLLLLPTLWSLILAARGIPPWSLVVIFSLGSFLMRSAGVILNDLADRRFDRHVTRTQQRPLAAGELLPWHALIVLSILLGAAGLLVLMLNPFTILLSPCALLLAGLYPFAKRLIQVPQAMLGIAFGWGTIMAWTASHGTIDAPAWLIFAATACWAVGYDTIYALQDREDDKRIGVKSSAIFFGSSGWLAVGVSFTAMVVLLGLAGWLTQIGWFFYGVLASASVFCTAQALKLRNPVAPSQAFNMFRQHVWVGTALLAGLLGGFLL
jgi:4-hydroxybenzoate polyprenyltransferase